MRNYEVGYIADPDLDEQALKDLQAKVRGWIEAAGGKAVEVTEWGRKRLAYPINKKSDGYYTFVHAELPPQAGRELEREFQLSENVIRYMITLKEPV